MLPGKRIMGLNPNAGVAHCLRQIISASHTLKSFFTETDLLEKHRKQSHPVKNELQDLRHSP